MSENDLYIIAIALCSKFKKNNSWPFSNEEKKLAKAIKHVHEMSSSVEEIEIGTHYESVENRKKANNSI